jgi:Flp pilus assembly CpaF family ATPase
VNGSDDVYVERKGRIWRVPDRLFEGEEAVLHMIERIVAPLGLRVDATSPWVDARLPDGSRVQTNFLGTYFRQAAGAFALDSPRRYPPATR